MVQAVRLITLTSDSHMIQSDFEHGFAVSTLPKCWTPPMVPPLEGKT